MRNGKIRWSDSISEFQILGVGGVKNTQDKNDEIMKWKTMTFRGFRYRELEVLRTLMTRVPKLRNAKCRNPETDTSTKTPFWSFTDREIKDQRNFNLWSSEPWNPKTDTSTNHVSKPHQLRTHGTIRQWQVSRWFNISGTCKSRIRVTRGSYSTCVNPHVMSASLHHIGTFYFGVLHSKKKIHHYDVSNFEMSKGTIVSLKKSKGKTLKSYQLSILVGYVNHPITSEIFWSWIL